MEIDELAGVEYLKTLTAQIKQINELSKESFELRYEKRKIYVAILANMDG